MRLSVRLLRASRLLTSAPRRLRAPAARSVPLASLPQSGDGKLKLALELLRIGVWDFDPKTRAITGSPECRAIFGLAADAKLTIPLLRRLIHPDDRSLLREAILQIVRGRPPGALEIQVRTNRVGRPPDGWVSFRIRAARDERGRPGRLIGTVQDITERKAAELDRKAGEERLAMALRVGNMVAWDRDLATGVVTRSPNATEMIGNRVEHASAFLARVHPDDRALVAWSSTDSAQPASGTVQFRYRHPTNGERWLETSAVQLFKQDHTGRVVGITTDITEKKATEMRLVYAASHDPLTGLLNRIAFNKELGLALQSRAEDDSVALLMMDLDSLKNINDTFGHDAGDLILRITAERLAAAPLPEGFLARLGGDEFALVLVGRHSVGTILDMAADLISRLAEPVAVNGQSLAIGSSIGIAVFPTQDPDPGSLVKNADLALYAAKGGGRHRARVYEPSMRRLFDERARLMIDVEAALEADQFIPFYQPKVDLVTGAIVGFEALARWLHPTRGILTPDVFGAAFEQGHLALAIGRTMLDKTLRDLRVWLDLGLPVGRIAINLSTFEFRVPDLAESLLAQLDRSGVDGSHFEIELTETVFLDRNPDGIIGLLSRFRQRGVKVSLDDFGTGYASLVHLKRFPVDEIKLDRSFVADLNQGPSMALMSGVIALGRGLGLTTVAEGIETPQQAEVLQRMGCDFGQGYLFAKPLAATRVPWLVQRGCRRLGGVTPRARTAV